MILYLIDKEFFFKKNKTKSAGKSVMEVAKCLWKCVCLFVLSRQLLHVRCSNNTANTPLFTVKHGPSLKVARSSLNVNPIRRRKYGIEQVHVLDYTNYYTEILRDNVLPLKPPPFRALPHDSAAVAWNKSERSGENPSFTSGNYDFYEDVNAFYKS